MDHTPLPWSVDTVAGSDGDFEGVVDYRIVDSQNRTILDSYNSEVRVIDELGHVVHNAQGETDLEFVAQACNNHYLLVSAAARLLCGLVGHDHLNVEHYDGILHDATTELETVLSSIDQPQPLSPAILQVVASPVRTTARRRLVRRPNPEE